MGRRRVCNIRTVKTTNDMDKYNFNGKEYVFSNEELEKAYHIARNAGYKVYTIKKDTDRISCLFVSNGKRVGYIETSYGGLSYSTMHKPERSIGTGFGLSGVVACDCASLEKINETFIFAPSGYGAYHHLIVKQTWDEFVRGDKILDYIELQTLNTLI